MSDRERARVTADEVAVEARYKKALDERAKSAQRASNRVASNTWTTSAKSEAPITGELIGRVALAKANEAIDGASNFYIGTARFDGGDLQVFNWAAPVACTYFRKSDDHHFLCDDVIGVRVLAHQAGRIVDHQDEVLVDESITDLFPARQLQVPRAPMIQPEVSKTDEVEPDTASIDVEDTVAVETTTRPILVPPKLPTAVVTPAVPPTQAVPGPSLRAPELLKRQLAAPKTASMASVLATLQPDQYTAITRNVNDTRFYQGHPGTGKTIIATHRAAYLLSKELDVEDRPNGKVLILGPTNEYVAHVRATLNKLIDDPSGFEVKSMPELLDDYAKLPHSSNPTKSELWEEVSQELADLIDSAVARARENVKGEQITDEDIYVELRWFLDDPPAKGLDPEWVKFLRGLPSTLGELRKSKVNSHRGFLAYIGVRSSRIELPGHIIVDEAQDVHPIEWAVLGRIGNRGGWTILGDLNQRRTDHTYDSWAKIAELLALEDDDGETPVEVLERGYRSTAQIIRFANQLLPTRERALYSIQNDGEAPVVTKAMSEGELYESAFAAATKLLENVGSGTVAVILMSTLRFHNVLSKKGWKADVGDPFTWRNANQVLRVLPPSRARGLEFDGVVVIEPSEFPMNFGRQGVLYTALTRANRLLTVVHHKPLPRDLKKPT